MRNPGCFSTISESGRPYLWGHGEPFSVVANHRSRRIHVLLVEGHRMARGVLAHLKGRHPETHGGQTQVSMAQPLAGKSLTRRLSTPFETPSPF